MEIQIIQYLATFVNPSLAEDSAHRDHYALLLLHTFI